MNKYVVVGIILIWAVILSVFMSIDADKKKMAQKEIDYAECMHSFDKENAFSPLTRIEMCSKATGFEPKKSAWKNGERIYAVPN